MMARILAAILGVVLLCTAGVASAMQISASLDRDHVQLGETVTLTVSAEGANSASAPDFDVLKDDFDVLGTSSNQSISVRNGEVSKTMRWGVALQPLRAGEIEIPALRVGSESTRPLHLTVGTQTTGTQAAAGGEVFVETSVEPGTAYVGQQVFISVRLYYEGALVQGNLGAPEVDGAELRQLGDELNYRAQRSGRDYHVVERRYALIAHDPGTLVVPAIRFQGQMHDGRFGGFFGGGRSVHARSMPHAVTITPKPLDADDGAWLPAHGLKLELTGLPAGGEAQVGVPINLQLSLQATGLPFESLPELSLPTIDAARIYPSQAATTTGDDGRWLKGERRREFAVVPTQSGVLTIPQISVSWWNTQTDAQEIARIPAHSLQVQAAAGAGGVTTVVNGEITAAVNGAAGMDAIPPIDNAGRQSRAWRLIAIAAIGLWLLTLVAWWLRRRYTRAKPQPVDAPSLGARKRAFLAAGNAQDLAHTLLAWARIERPDVHNLGDLSTQLDSTEQTATIAQLERHRYAAASEMLDVAAMQSAFRRGFVWHKPGAAGGTHSLAPLYPDRK